MIVGRYGQPTLIMKSIRQRLTGLINKVKESLPNGPDIYGYEGISKDIVIESISESYELLNNLEEHKEKFEVIFLQRNLAKLIDQAKDGLKGNLITSTESKFDDFLNTIQGIRYNIKETYIAVTEHPIRVDTELNTAKEQLNEINENIDELTELNEKITTIKDTSEGLLSQLEQKNEVYESHLETLQENEKIIETSKANVLSAADEVEEWNEEINKATLAIKKNSAEYEALVESIDSLKEDSVNFNNKYESQLTLLSEANNKNIEQQELIQKTIEDANRAGMAGSFKKRKDELRGSLIFWQFFTIISLGLLIYLSFILVKPLISDPNWEEIIVKLPIIASCVWLCWFSSKQYGFTARIREDYSYKYAVSMAFEGYKNAAREINDDLLEQLLGLTVLNISKNPISIFDTKNNHGSPINELIDSSLKRIHIKSSKSGVEVKNGVE